MRLSKRQIARAHELLPRAMVLQKRHGIKLASTVNKGIDTADTATIESVLHELAHFIVMEEPPGRSVTDRINDLMASLSTYVTDELELDTGYVTLEAGIELGLWSWRGAFQTFVEATAGALREGDSRNQVRVTRAFCHRANRRLPALGDRIRWLVDWFLHDEAREAWRRAREAPIIKAAN